MVAAGWREARPSLALWSRVRGDCPSGAFLYLSSAGGGAWAPLGGHAVYLGIGSVGKVNILFSQQFLSPLKLSSHVSHLWWWWGWGVAGAQRPTWGSKGTRVTGCGDLAAWASLLEPEHRAVQPTEAMVGPPGPITPGETEAPSPHRWQWGNWACGLQPRGRMCRAARWAGSGRAGGSMRGSRTPAASRGPGRTGCSAPTPRGLSHRHCGRPAHLVAGSRAPSGLISLDLFVALTLLTFPS